MQRWILVVALSLMNHGAATSASAFQSPSSTLFTSSSSAAAAASLSRVKSGYFSPTTSRIIICSGDDSTAIAAAAQPFMECCTMFNSAALLSSSSSLALDVTTDVFNTDNYIKLAFSVATFFPQIPWLFLILLPNTNVTKKLMGGYEIITICCLVHFFIVIASIAQPDGTAPMAEFANVFDPSGDPQKAMVGMMKYPNFVSEEWSHVLTWDLFVGRWIWLDGLRRDIFTAHSVLLCNLIGPPGLLLHWVTTCLVTGKGLPGNEAPDINVNDET